jgi:hypothetical protein
MDFLLTLLSRLGENVQGGFDIALIKRDGGKKLREIVRGWRRCEAKRREVEGGAGAEPAALRRCCGRGR